MTRVLTVLTRVVTVLRNELDAPVIWLGIGIGLLAAGAWMAWKPAGLLVPGAVITWIVLPSRVAFIARPKPVEARRAPQREAA